VSEIVAQVSQEPDLKRFYDDIFDEHGCEIYVKPAGLYFAELPQVVSFADWRKIDAAEIERGQSVGKPRDNFTAVDEMLALLG